MKSVNIRKLVMCALLMAICFVVTRFLSMPLFYTKGYVNLGDVAVIMCAYVLGGWYGAAAAAFGAALSDASLAFYPYVPATFVIKGAMVFVAAFFFDRGAKVKSCTAGAVMIVLGVVLAEVLMVAGYFMFESFLYSSVAVAAMSVIGNLVQGIVCAVPSVIVVFILSKNPVVLNMRKKG